jgi:hypothetical protein
MNYYVVCAEKNWLQVKQVFMLCFSHQLCKINYKIVVAGKNWLQVKKVFMLGFTY